jgi:hypothetical protein
MAAAKLKAVGDMVLQWLLQRCVTASDVDFEPLASHRNWCIKVGWGLVAPRRPLRGTVGDRL